jgi:single-strand DNA-binding protein
VDPPGRAGAASDRDDTDRNDVVLLGRVSAAPEERELPSGDRVVAFRVVVRRPERSRRGGVDALDCAAWRSDVRRVVARWKAGDLVQVTGAVRRRFWRSAGRPSSVWEIEVARARRVARAS